MPGCSPTGLGCLLVSESGIVHRSPHRVAATQTLLCSCQFEYTPSLVGSCYQQIFNSLPNSQEHLRVESERRALGGEQVGTTGLSGPVSSRDKGELGAGANKGPLGTRKTQCVSTMISHLSFQIVEKCLLLKLLNLYFVMTP